jgi:D-beta-D-heptose 7-phosphate kinase/D-beta-D-heptose 1-phosphate adenosyltransferase
MRVLATRRAEQVHSVGLGTQTDNEPLINVKLKTLPELVDLAAQARRKNLRVVFTNGCFDLLHVGHTRYLQEARALGDLLIVAINSDASVSALKGPERPLVPEQERAEVLAALACVDYLTIFDAPDPGDVIASIQPDVLAKGGDWPVERIVGREVVEARGGRVVSIPLVPGASTTGLVRRILERGKYL